MASLARHNYAPLADSERGDRKDVEITEVASPTGTRNFVGTAILMIIAGVAGAFISTVAQRAMATGGVGPDVTSLQNLLSFPSEVHKFVPDETFASPASPETDHAWMELLGPSRGFIALESPETYGLGPGRVLGSDKTSQVYGVSMFHQLHCLIMIRDIYYGVLQGKYDASEYNSVNGSEVTYAVEHTEHCFDYLQQSIRCAGLMQIEEPHGSRNNVFDGYWSEHTCKSWKSISEFMDKYQVAGRSGQEGPHEDSETRET